MYRMTLSNSLTTLNDKPNEGGNPLLILTTMCKKECCEYNGYTNYQTWVYNLHISNDIDPLKFYEEQLETMVAYEFAKYLKNELIEAIDETKYNPLLTDLLDSAVDEINFGEIAEDLLETYWENKTNEQ